MNTDNLIMVQMNQSHWDGHKFDGAASESVTKNSGAESGAVRMNKLIVPKSIIRPSQAHWSAVRSWFYKQTSPFYDGGWRVRPLHDFVAFQSQFLEHQDTADALVKELIEVAYPTAVENAQVRMGGLYNAGDYPNPETLRNKFSITIDYQPVPVSADNWLVKLDEFTKNLVEETTKSTEESIEQEPWLRLYDPLERFKRALEKSLGEPHSTFRSNIVDQITDACDTALALSADPYEVNLNDTVEYIRTDICLTADVKLLRKDNSYRKHIAMRLSRAIKRIQENI
ncbi:MAG TPA: hypothetical protein EYF95_02160 [Flavobacteriales bacterium]|nr:hypothetical protein [Flavobacteriales bacterium]